jgi:NAD(P)-dependent dehydrogenase (short-subunit alcohol dehydrogenase family)
MLENKTAVIYGGGGAIGGAVARAFADAGARVHLAGRSRARLDLWFFPAEPEEPPTVTSAHSHRLALPTCAVTAVATDCPSTAWLGRRC